MVDVAPVAEKNWKKLLDVFVQSVKIAKKKLKGSSVCGVYMAAHFNGYLTSSTGLICTFYMYMYVYMCIFALHRY